MLVLLQQYTAAVAAVAVRLPSKSIAASLFLVSYRNARAHSVNIESSATLPALGIGILLYTADRP